MAGAGSRSRWIVPALMALAAVLLALSFVPWGDGTATAAATATATPPPAAPTQSPAEVGRVLFGVKGCASCHRHDGMEVERLSFDGQVVPASQFVGAEGAPNLTHYQPDPHFVRKWLADPKAVRPNTPMPNLRLSEKEIEALAAFLETNTPAGE